MARWTNKIAIIRDLAQAQGRAPVEIEQALPFNERPPRDIYQEETEEEYFQDLGANGDIGAGPDIGMIQEMLELLRDTDISPEGDEIVITKPDREKFIPGPSKEHGSIPFIAVEENKKIKDPPKKKRNRNAAVESLIAAYGDSDLNSATIQTKSDLYVPPALRNKLKNSPKKAQIKENVKNDVACNNKVNSWLDSIDSGAVPTSMFKKKAISAENYKKKSPVSSKHEESTNSNTGVFVPSSMANEYYEKFVERSKTKQIIKEDIWTRAERLMAEIDKRKKENMSASSNIESVESEVQGMISPPLLHEPTIPSEVVSQEDDNNNTRS